MFDPRKLIPLSIELWSAPMAVMTEMTEKTPIVIPVMVNADRSLFAPSDVRAMTTISRNLITPLLPLYSYLSAVTGSNREADHAGAKPETNPVSTETIMLVTTKPNEI